jgi:8-oxo-dGTP pyrophosphatase MutT (NUDIX family)
MKEMNFEFSSGGVVFKKVGGKTFWLITRSSSSQAYPESYWRLPKGWVDDDKNNPGPLTRGKKEASEKNLQEAALREVREEGGVDARIIKKIGTYKIFFIKEGQKTLKFITFYLMEWRENLSEGYGFETSETEWCPLSVAEEKLKYKSEKEVIQKANRVLSLGVQNGLI